MALPLPHTIPDRYDIQGNFDEISRQWPNKNVGVFSAYRNAASALPTGAVVPFETKEYDVSGWLDVVTNVGRYTPKLPAYYRLSWLVSTFPAAGVNIQAILLKNGAFYKRAPPNIAGAGGGLAGHSVNVKANGTDYFEIQIVHNAGGNLALLVGAVDLTYFQGEMIAP